MATSALNPTPLPSFALLTRGPLPPLPQEWQRRYTAGDYANAMMELLPPGKAWDWPLDGAGFALFKAFGEELARLGWAARDTLPKTVLEHLPAGNDWHISTYQRIADWAAENAGCFMKMRFMAGRNKPGHRLWAEEMVQDCEVGRVEVTHLVTRPFTAGFSRAAHRLWNERGRYFIVVRYHPKIANLPFVMAALKRHAQAHVVFLMQDITQRSNEYATY